MIIDTTIFQSTSFFQAEIARTDQIRPILK
jgi:hypothetical protein